MRTGEPLRRTFRPNLIRGFIRTILLEIRAKEEGTTVDRPYQCGRHEQLKEGASVASGPDGRSFPSYSHHTHNIKKVRRSSSLGPRMKVRPFGAPGPGPTGAYLVQSLGEIFLRAMQGSTVKG
jgi:hypothetical protein